MCVKCLAMNEIPAETQRVARAAFPQGNVAMRLRDELGMIYKDEQVRVTGANLAARLLGPLPSFAVRVRHYRSRHRPRRKAAAESIAARIARRFPVITLRRRLLNALNQTV